ncbi:MULTISPECIES: DUF4932 domain-containing protein [unclassified Sphingobacterium]|uniref:DUF4932 domain-containing protein n=1 Tax=unclassified Sphingobacterium TaxID=2609468 RepID=UPI0025F393EB|nr:MULTISPECIES: DUF4932 domain-containing protein [unclassified Sphingobacterium]
MKRNLILVLTSFILTWNLALCQQREVDFSNAYIAHNDGKTTVEINEAQELVYIIFSITDFGKENPNMTKQNTEYFEEVKSHFTAFSDLPIVKKFDQQLRENLTNYFLLAANVYGFKFKDDELIPTNIYIFPAKGVGNYQIKSNPIPAYKKELEEFIRKSGYRAFYKQHKPYYDSLRAAYEEYASIAEQKEWLEKRFNYKINSYRILTSPLIAGMNATHTFKYKGFKEILLFLPTLREDESWSPKFKKAINTRIIFTEIDHNYVGPLSEKNKKQIDTIFNNREFWIDASNKSTVHYPSPVKVFDEYLTWGLFILYCYDKFGEDYDLFGQIVENVNDMMVNKKGFPKADEFNAELFSRYKDNKNKDMESLYKPLLEWCSRQN